MFSRFREQACSHSGSVSNTNSVFIEDRMWERACSRMQATRSLLNQHLSVRSHVLEHLLLHPRMNQFHRPAPIRARQGLGGAEQPANQRPLVIHRATIRPQMHTVEFFHSGILLGVGLARQTRHFFGRGGHRPAAVMAAGNALERGNLLSQCADCLAVAAH